MDTTDEAAIAKIFAEQYAAFEHDRLRRQQEIEEARLRRSRRTSIQWWFLFAVLIGSFVLLAYRTEVNAADLRDYINQACQSRAERAVVYNQGREVLIELIVNNPKNPTPPDQVATVTEQLRNGLLIPVEDCAALAPQ